MSNVPTTNLEEILRVLDSMFNSRGVPFYVKESPKSMLRSVVFSISESEPVKEGICILIHPGPLMIKPPYSETGRYGGILAEEENPAIPDYVVVSAFEEKKTFSPVSQDEVIRQLREKLAQNAREMAEKDAVLYNLSEDLKASREEIRLSRAHIRNLESVAASPSSVMEDVFELVRSERKRQTEKWGDQGSNDLNYQIRVEMEELGEWAQEIDLSERIGCETANLLDEIVQVASVACWSAEHYLIRRKMREEKGP